MFQGIKKKINVDLRKDELDGILTDVEDRAGKARYLIIAPNAKSRKEYMDYRNVDCRFLIPKGFFEAIKGKQNGGMQVEVFAALPDLLELFKEEWPEIKPAPWFDKLEKPKPKGRPKSGDKEDSQ